MGVLSAMWLTRLDLLTNQAASLRFPVTPLTPLTPGLCVHIRSRPGSSMRSFSKPPCWGSYQQGGGWVQAAWVLRWHWRMQCRLVQVQVQEVSGRRGPCLPGSGPNQRWCTAGVATPPSTCRILPMVSVVEC